MIAILYFQTILPWNWFAAIYAMIQQKKLCFITGFTLRKNRALCVQFHYLIVLNYYRCLNQHTVACLSMPKQSLRWRLIQVPAPPPFGALAIIIIILFWYNISTIWHHKLLTPPRRVCPAPRLPSPSNSRAWPLSMISPLGFASIPIHNLECVRNLHWWSCGCDSRRWWRHLSRTQRIFQPLEIVNFILLLLFNILECHPPKLSLHRGLLHKRWRRQDIPYRGRSCSSTAKWTAG